MSIKLMTQVWDCNRWAGSDLVMMLALADFANDSGYCWPSVDTLAKKCRVSSRQAQRIIHGLMDEDNPCLERARTGNGAGNSSMYRIIASNMEKGDAHDILLDEERVTPMTSFEEKRVTPASKRVTSRAKKGDMDVTRSIIEPPITTTTTTGDEQPLPPTTPFALQSGGGFPATTTEAASTPQAEDKAATDFAVAAKMYENNFGLFTPIAGEMLGDLISTYGVEWVLDAMKVAVSQEKRKLAYVGGILRGWHTNGKTPPGTPRGGGNTTTWAAAFDDPSVPDYMRELANGD